MKNVARSLMATLLLLGSTFFVAGQSLTTGAITGSVTDQSGGVMPRVVIVATNTGTGVARETHSSASGSYLLAELDPGTYNVTAQSSGFAKMQIGPIAVVATRIATIDLRLRVGEATQVVNVKESAPLVEPNNPNTTITFDARELSELPNPGNDLSYVASLAPGAIMNTKAANQTGYAGNVEFNGLPSTSNDFTIDGLDANNTFAATNMTGASGLQLGLNAIQEVTISTAVYAVDQGKLGASQIDYITKSGTNSFHGNAYELWNGASMNAQNFFLKADKEPKPRSNVNEFGASLGGPVLRKRLFFFGDLEGVRLVLPVVLTSTVPTAAYQSYVLQQLPLGGVDTVRGGMLPAQPAELPLYKNMFALIGSPSKGAALAVPGCPFDVGGASAMQSNDGTGCAVTNTFSASPFATETLFTAKLDYDVNPNDSFWFRFQLNQGQRVIVDPVSSVFNDVERVPSRSGAAGWTHVFNSNLVNQFNPGLEYVPSVFNLADASKALEALPISYFVRPFSTIGNNLYSTPSGQVTTKWQANDNLSWTKGRHSFKFGGDLRRYLFTTEYGTYVNPLEQGCSLPEFTYGATCSTSQAFPIAVHDRVRAVSMGLYAMDNIRISPRVNVTLGLRSTWNSDPVSANRAFVRFDGPFDSIPHDANRPLNLDILSGQSLMFPSTPLLQWQPRIGVAYQVRPRTVLRAGFGLFDQPPTYGIYSAIAQNPPSYNLFHAGLLTPIGGIAIAPGVPGSAVDAAIAANQQYQEGYASGELSCASPLSTPGQCLSAVSLTIPSNNPGYRNPYEYEWGASIQHQITNDVAISIAYVGTRMREGVYGTFNNSFQTYCNGCFSPLPFDAGIDQRFSTVESRNNGANSSYDALQITAEKRLGRGLSLRGNYTYSHCIDFGSNAGFEPFNANASNLAIGNNLQTLRGSCDYDLRHSLNLSYLYQLPLRARSGWLRVLSAGWQVAGTAYFHGGFPFTVYSYPAFGVQNNPVPLEFANLIQGQSKYSKSSIAGVTLPGTIQWLNPNAFQSVINPLTSDCYPITSPQNCQNGDFSRNTLRGPGFAWTDLDLSKQFKITERLSFKFDAQFYNALNHPNFGLPNTGLPLAGNPANPGTLSGFGTINSTVAPSTSLVGGRLGADSSVRMIALKGSLQF